MKTSSLLGLTLELLESVATPGPYPADARIGRFFRDRRYLGSHDRRSIAQNVYAWLRSFPRARARWRAWRDQACPASQTASPGGTDAETVTAPASPVSSPPAQEHLTWEIVADLVALARDRLLAWDCGEVLAAAREWMGAPPPRRPPPPLEGPGGPDALLRQLLAEPEAASRYLPEHVWPDDPAGRLEAATSLPAWLATALTTERGDDEARLLAAGLGQPAPLDLRVNVRSASRETVRQALEDELAVPVTLTPWSPVGLRIARRVELANTRASRSGWLEVEDEGSQVVVLAAEPARGTVIIDACAGAGGKTLALADAVLPGEAGSGRSAPRPPGHHRPRGRLIACDISRPRLEELERRARNAGVRRYLDLIPTGSDGPLPPEVPEADLVLVDAPCSGFGTLRRSPDLKLRYGPDDVREFQRVQREILERWSSRVRQGGRLVYITCSILAAENEEVALAFGDSHPDFRSYLPAWALGTLPPRAIRGAFVGLDPVTTGTDAFFLAAWRRS